MSNKHKRSSLTCSPEQAYEHFAWSAKDEGRYLGFPEVCLFPTAITSMTTTQLPLFPSSSRRYMLNNLLTLLLVKITLPHHLKNFPSTHHFLAKLFSKMLLQSKPHLHCGSCRNNNIAKEGKSDGLYRSFQFPSNFPNISSSQAIPQDTGK